MATNNNNDNKTPAVVVKDGVQIKDAYVKDGKTYDKNGAQVTGDFTTSIGEKTFTSGNGGGGSSSSSSSSSSSNSSYNPSNVPPIGNLKDVPTNKIVLGNVYVDGVLKKDMPLYDGIFYDPVSGKPLSTTHTGDGLYDPKDYKKFYQIDANGIPTGYFDSKKESTSSNDYYYYQEPIVYPPPKVDFNEPIPTFKSNLTRTKKYIYYFGLDQVEAKNVQIDKTSCIVSSYIEVGNLGDEDYIQIDASYYSDANSSIEFYIIDGEKEVPLLPINTSSVEHESLFVNLFTRFDIDTSKPVVVRNNGTICSKPYLDVISKIDLWKDSSNRHEYTISYTPLGGVNYKPINTKIQVKAIIRCYTVTDNPPYIENVCIRKYMKAGLWV